MTIVKRITGTAVALTASLLLCELLLRSIPSPIQYPPLHEFDDPASLLGIEIVPSTRAVIREPCLTAVNTTNTLGWRDRERTIARVPGKMRIAAIGDSFIETSQVNDDQTLTQQLERMLGSDRVEVLNFGLSSVGTVQEEILEERVVEAFDPDTILLFFYQNDVIDSSRELSQATGANHLTYRDANGQLVSSRRSSPLFGLRKWLRIHSAIFRLVKLADQRLRALFSRELHTATVSSVPFQYHVYENPPPAEWQRAWADVEQALTRLHDRLKVKRRLFFVIVPDILQVAPDARVLFRQEYGVDPPASFDPLQPNRLIREIAARQRIETIDLLPSFLAERDRRHLEFPYFSFTCDGHWSALGQQVAAEAIARVLASPPPHAKPTPGIPR